MGNKKGFGNKSDNEGANQMKRKWGMENGLSEYFGAKTRHSRANWRNKLRVAAQ
jgi:hypothetical protein